MALVEQSQQGRHAEPSRPNSNASTSSNYSTSLAPPTPDAFRPLSHASTSSNYSVQDEVGPPLPLHTKSQNLPGPTAHSSTEVQTQSQSQPQPQAQVQLAARHQNRKAPHKPPPSARRGPSSYYSQRPCVSPIIEEWDSIYSDKRASRGSYASSGELSDGEFASILEQEEDSAVPVRQASFSKRSKPTLTTIQSHDKGGTKSRDRSMTTMDLLESSPPTKKMSQEPEKGFVSGELDAAATGESKEPEQPVSFAQKIGSRRPPRLNIDAVREAETRASLTSLPDLLRRATRVAANLDRGKTASRFGTDWISEAQLEPQASDNRRSRNSLLDILSFFPPPRPAQASSPVEKEFKDVDIDLYHSDPIPENDQYESRHPIRRWCGMSLGSLLMIIAVLLLITLAAIVIPIVVVKQQQAHSASAVLASCRKSLTCENGAANIVGSSGSCGCICVDGYTGSTCSTKSTSSCATADINANGEETIGSAIPRLLAASANFSVPLNGSAVLSLFTSNDLSCASENALVTFDGLSTRSIRLDADAMPIASVDTRSEGIALDAENSSSGPAARSLTSAVSLTASVNSTTLDFARVAILYTMQDSGALENAVTAQLNLQNYFTSGTTNVGATIDAANVTLAAGYFADLQDYTITTANGTRIG